LETKDLRLNRPQLRGALLAAPFEVFIAGRATGKSFYMAWLIHTIVHKLPRSSWAIVGRTFKEILTRTLPSTLKGLRFLGYEEGVHFFLNRRPPSNMDYALPIEPLGSYEHTIVFLNGTVFRLVSQDRSGNSRGPNFDGALSDEGLTLNEEKFKQETIPAIRGNEDQFKGSAWHKGVKILSSMPHTSQGTWLMEYGNYYERHGINNRVTRDRLTELQLEFVDAESDKERQKMLPDMQALYNQLQYYKHIPDNKNEKPILYHEANAFENINNLGLGYILNQRKILTHLDFLIEILNKRMRRIQKSFYPYLDDRVHVEYETFNNSHLDKLQYDQNNPIKEDSRQDDDLAQKQPLEISVDWGSDANFMTVCQQQGNVFRFLKEFYVKHPKFLNHLFEEFAEYYKHHPAKSVYFHFDVNGNYKLANSDMTYATQAASILRSYGWGVTFMSDSTNPEHGEKYQLWQNLLQELESRMPKIRINGHNCPHLLISLQQTGVKQTERLKIKKDKSSETDANVPAEEASHFSDAADIIVYDKFAQYLDINTLSFDPISFH